MLSQRKEEILRIIVEEYIHKAKPVGSKSICDKLNVSSATVRSEMQSLEEEGLLLKTHTSSGRIPSDHGYRYYVDHLMQPKDLTGEDMLKLQTIFKNNELELSDAIKKGLEIVSDITQYTSVILGKHSSENKLKQVEIVEVAKDNYVAIVITDKGQVEHKTIHMNEKHVSFEEVKKMVDLINQLIVGTPIDEVVGKLEFEIKPIIGKYVKQHEILYNAFKDAFNDMNRKNSMYLLGRTNTIKHPEFNNADKMRSIIDKFEDESLVSKFETSDNDINIYIGEENEFDPDVTIVRTSYNVDGEEGTIAVIGPKRMEYERVVTLLNYLKNQIED